MVIVSRDQEDKVIKLTNSNSVNSSQSEHYIRSGQMAVKDKLNGLGRKIYLNVETDID